MSKVLIVGEHDGENLNAATAKCVTCAAQIGEVDVLIAASDAGAIAGQAAAITGVNNVLTMPIGADQATLAAVVAPCAASLGSEYTHILGPSTTFGKDVMPRVAALLGVAQISDMMEVVASHEFKRPIYAGNAIVSVTAPDNMVVVGTVRVASYQAAGNEGSGAISEREAPANLPTHTRFVGVQTGSSDRPDLQTAPKVVSGGRALGSEENFEIIYALADKMGAGVGASRAAVDAGYVPNDMQVGQTGKIIAPDLYMAIGISGAIQHLTGIKDAGTIVAINKDEEAPIFEVSDIGLVGDLFKIVPELTEALS